MSPQPIDQSSKIQHYSFYNLPWWYHWGLGLRLLLMLLCYPVLGFLSYEKVDRVFFPEQYNKNSKFYTLENIEMDNTIRSTNVPPHP